MWYDILWSDLSMSTSDTSHTIICIAWFLTKKNFRALDGFGIAMIVCSSLSVRRTDYALR